MMPEPVKGKRTDWVSTAGDNGWSQSATPTAMVFEAGPKTSYRAGQHAVRGVVQADRTALPERRYTLPSRTRRAACTSTSRPGAAGNHVGMTRRRPQPAAADPLPGPHAGDRAPSRVSGRRSRAGNLPYRLVVTGSRDATFTPYSSSTRTTWDLRPRRPRPTAAGRPAAGAARLSGWPPTRAGPGLPERHADRDRRSLPGAVEAGQTGPGRPGAVLRRREDLALRVQPRQAVPAGRPGRPPTCR